MKLAFYAVTNSMNYERDSFNLDTPDVILEKLSKLPENEVRIYDLSCYGYDKKPAPNLADFEEDYNNEDFDGGWWTIVINKA